MSLRENLVRWLGRTGVGGSERTSGAPTSSNGASSFHLRWDVTVPLVSASVVFEVLDEPTVDRLYFWALQTDFVDSTTGAGTGGAHLGPQWHPSYPGNTAVCWGGYAARGGELRGSDSALASATANPNVRNLPWRANHPYRLTVSRVLAPTAGEALPEGFHRWRGQVADLSSGDQVVVRDLFVDGDLIGGVTMWSEVFARCDDPSVSVRWSDPSARTPDGVEVRPRGVHVNYQSHAEGGCANTDSSSETVHGGVAVVQRTAVQRRTPQGAYLPFV